MFIHHHHHHHWSLLLDSSIIKQKMAWPMTIQRGTFSLTTVRSVILDDFGVGYFGGHTFMREKTFVTIEKETSVTYTKPTSTCNLLLLLSALCCCCNPFSYSYRTSTVLYLCGPPHPSVIQRVQIEYRYVTVRHYNLICKRYSTRTRTARVVQYSYSTRTFVMQFYEYSYSYPKSDLPPPLRPRHAASTWH